MPTTRRALRREDSMGWLTCLVIGLVLAGSFLPSSFSIASAAAPPAANGASLSPAISGDGRFVTFASAASNLVTGDTNGAVDIFVVDRTTGAVSRVSASSTATQANGASLSPAISGDGRFVTFASAASNLVTGDTNGAVDIFVVDRTTGAVSRVSVSSTGTQANGASL